eukprot:5917670-Pleurochrysis_carterae.AAC.1
MGRSHSEGLRQVEKWHHTETLLAAAQRAQMMQRLSVEGDQFKHTAAKRACAATEAGGVCSNRRGGLHSNALST